MTTDAKEIYKQAIGKWGEYPQLQMVIEEMSELTKEICKVFRGKWSLRNLSEEMADVYIMLEQMELMLDNKKQVQKFKEIKLKRLEERLKEEKLYFNPRTHEGCDEK